MFYKETDYNKFKFLEYNRCLNTEKSKLHIEKLKTTLSHSCDLSSMPIKVTKDLQIIDGQHRFEAAKMLGIPIYYYIDEHFKPESLIKCNNDRLNWDTENYLNFYVHQNYPEYIKLNDFLKTRDMTIKEYCRFICIHGKELALFRAGNFDFKLPDERLIIVTNILLDKLSRNTLKTRVLSRGFIIGLIHLFSCNSFDFAHFIKQIENNYFRLNLVVGDFNWTSELVDFYNHKKIKNRLKITFQNKTKYIVILDKRNDDE